MKTEANSQMAAFVLGRDDIVPRLASGSDEGEKQMDRDILGLNWLVPVILIVPYKSIVASSYFNPL